MKMIHKKGTSFLLAILMLFSVSSCDLFDMDINTDPNNPTEASLELLLTNTMLNASSTFAGDLNDMASGFMAQSTAFDDFNMDNTSWNFYWNYLYSNPLADLERIIVAAEEQGNNPHYLGIARVMKAYYFSLMVDLWGDVPYSQAFKGDAGNKQPVYDDDEAIYNDLISLLDNALVNFGETSSVRVLGDIIYNNGGTGVAAATQMGRWKKAAKSLKLRLLLQMRRVRDVTADVQALINEGDLILTAADDFQFRFGKLVEPDDRHPLYKYGYAGGEAGASYFGHQLMVEMLERRDPRTPFYFKRQTKVILNPEDPTDKQTIPCSQRDDCIYGYLVKSPTVTNRIYGKDPDALTTLEAEYLAGFFGRDRSDPSGIPNDNPIRTTIGAYPYAGLFDDVPETGGGNKGSGDGIFPMISSWMVNFYLLEAQISLGVVSGKTDSELLKAALDAQMVKVFSVGAAADPAVVVDVTQWPATYTNWAVTYKTQTAFVADVIANYPAAGDANAKLNYTLKQAWYANFGNGFEIYNAFRRTGFPNDLQAPMQRPRNFALRLPYAQDELNLNKANTPTIVYDSPSDALFWDVLKFQF